MSDFINTPNDMNDVNAFLSDSANTSDDDLFSIETPLTDDFSPFESNEDQTSNVENSIQQETSNPATATQGAIVQQNVQVSASATQEKPNQQNVQQQNQQTTQQQGQQTVQQQVRDPIPINAVPKQTETGGIPTAHGTNQPEQKASATADPFEAAMKKAAKASDERMAEAFDSKQPMF